MTAQIINFPTTSVSRDRLESVEDSRFVPQLSEEMQVLIASQHDLTVVKTANGV